MQKKLVNGHDQWKYMYLNKKTKESLQSVDRAYIKVGSFFRMNNNAKCELI